MSLKSSEKFSKRRLLKTMQRTGLKDEKEFTEGLDEAKFSRVIPLLRVCYED